jgi:antitoxin ParD1/3/4
MEINLAPEFEQLVTRKVDTGRFSSATEVLQEALRVMDERDRLVAHCGGDIDEKIAQGLASLRRGEGVDSEEFFDQLFAEMDNAGEQGADEAA